MKTIPNTATIVDEFDGINAPTSRSWEVVERNAHIPHEYPQHLPALLQIATCLLSSATGKRSVFPFALMTAAREVLVLKRSARGLRLSLVTLCIISFALIWIFSLPNLTKAIASQVVLGMIIIMICVTLYTVFGRHDISDLKFSADRTGESLKYEWKESMILRFAHAPQFVMRIAGRSNIRIDTVTDELTLRNWIMDGLKNTAAGIEDIGVPGNEALLKEL